MTTTIVSSDGTSEVIEKKPPPVKEPEPKVEAPKVTEPVDDEDEDVAEGELSEKAKRIILKKEAAIGRKHRAMREAEELARDQFNERKAAEKRAEELQAELSALKSQAAQAPEKTRADFKTDEEWIDYRADLRLQAKEKERLERQLSEEKAQIEAGHQARIEAFSQTVPDWQEAGEALAAKNLEVSPAFEQFMYESDASPQVLYHYMKHPDELKELLKLKPTRQIKALGELETKLIAAPVKQEITPPANGKTLSRAPAPITPIAEGASPQAKDPVRLAEEGRTDEFLALQRERRRAKLRH